MRFVACVASVLCAVQLAQCLVPPFLGSPSDFRLLRKGAEDLQDFNKTTPEMVEGHGYPIETHEVETEDGYLLAVHRIPRGRHANPAAPAGTPVLLMHGASSSSADWVCMGPTKGLAYILADAGYDVWMPNARGNLYSRRHRTLNPDKQARAFFDFSWHEIGTRDLPAAIDYIVAATGEPRIHYVGHSQGTTVSYVLMAERPEYNRHLRLVSSLGPAAWMAHLSNIYLQMYAPMHLQLELYVLTWGLWEQGQHTDAQTQYGATFCADGALTQEACAASLYAIGGYNPDQLNKTMLPVIMSNAPAGQATKNGLHYLQLVASNKFRQYDHGMAQNMIEYGSMVPPNYDLKRATARVALFYADNDALVSPKDVEQLYKALPNVVEKYLVADKTFSHLDFIWGIDAPTLVYDYLLAAMNKYSD